ncbi:MAG: DUF2798 domain-containing protein [Devosia sp.]
MPFRKLPRSYGAFVAPLLLSLLMSAIVSAISLVRSQGFDAHVLDLWPGAWLASFVIAFPILLLAMPVVRWLTAAS